MLKKAFLEITNACNLSCSFCHGTKRQIHYMTTEEFNHATDELQGVAEYLQNHPKIAWVKYAGLPGDAYYERAQ